VAADGLILSRAVSRRARRCGKAASMVRKAANPSGCYEAALAGLRDGSARAIAA
jgi:hypothetical protein